MGEIEVDLIAEDDDGDMVQDDPVLAMYQNGAETYLRKNADYGDSFRNSAKLQSILEHGEVREDELRDNMAQQVFVRGFLDKLSRFHQLALEDNDAQVEEESVHDTLMDLGNYALMLAAQYEGGDE